MSWSQPDTRRRLLQGLEEKGFGAEQLDDLRRIVDAEKSDLYDVLAYVAYRRTPLTREKRVETHRNLIFAQHYQPNEEGFLSFVLDQYVKSGVGELDDQRLPDLIELKYHTPHDAEKVLGNMRSIRELFIGFQKHLYDDGEAA